MMDLHCTLKILRGKWQTATVWGLGWIVWMLPKCRVLKRSGQRPKRKMRRQAHYPSIFNKMRISKVHDASLIPDLKIMQMLRKTGLVIKATFLFRSLKQPNSGVLFHYCSQGTSVSALLAELCGISPHCLNPVQPSTAQQPHAGSSDHREPRARLRPNPKQKSKLKSNPKHSKFYSENCLKITVKQI